MTFLIRKMEKSDISQVQYVAKVSWNETYKGIIPIAIQNRFLRGAYSDEMLFKRMDNTNFIVAISNEKVIGFANFSPVSPDGKVELLAIYLHPSFQGDGVGTALLHAGINDLGGIKEVLVHVEKANRIGIDFYVAKGFTVISEFEENFYGHLLQTVVMSLHV